MTRRLRATIVFLALLVPSDGIAQQAPWFPGIPNPFQPAPTAPTAPSAPPPQAPAHAPAAPVATATGAPVVLELFTSEDCAACESAEYAVNRLSNPPVAGVRLVPLAFHVEFLGGGATKDPYVLAASTSRQNTYDAARGRIYTPQAIVDGDREFLGSEDGTARTAIAAAARLPKTSMVVSRAARVVGSTSLGLSVRYGAAGGRRATLTAVLAESGLVETHHGGLTDYDRTPLVPVVRSVQAIGAAAAGGGTANATLTIPAGAVRANLTAVVLLEDASTHHVLGVGTLPAGAF